jgi:16S rRNA (guanine1516-N2)-methyltransferase
MHFKKEEWAIAYSGAEMLEKAAAVADFLGVKLLQEQEQDDTKEMLWISAEGVAWKPKARKKPLIIDFLHPSALRRLVSQASYKEPLVKAIGCRPSQAFKILDMTAGWGRDGFLLAVLKNKVTLWERSPVGFLVLKDAIERAKSSERFAHLKMELFFKDALSLSAESVIAAKSDIVYLDPMFPQRRKTALVKQEMQLLKYLVGEDVDAEGLFLQAQQLALKRIVVKRHRLAPPLNNQKPDVVYAGKTCRFDVYLLV